MNKNFDTTGYVREFKQIFAFLQSKARLKLNDMRQILRKYPKDGKGIFSREELVTAYRYFVDNKLIQADQNLLDKIKMKPSRTISGVVPVTVLTKPWPCPGKCIFCPSDVRMPKSYLADEPGAQRALRNEFDPYLQVYNRLLAFHNIGHTTEKVELIVLGGTWSVYPLNYRIWFIKRCFQAMNDFGVDDRRLGTETEQVVSWENLFHEQIKNESAKSRNVGLVLETRPDFITKDEIVNLRHLGATKIQIGIQSLDNEILRANGRGHTVDDSVRAVAMLRSAGFKIHVHWMPNLYGATVVGDKADYLQIWQKIAPDELKIYPTSIISGTKLAEYYDGGKYHPYNYPELVDLLKYCFVNTPRYCRLTRVVRDIPAPDIVAGNKFSNLRQIIDQELIKDGKRCQCIRCREVRLYEFDENQIKLNTQKYETPTTIEYFLSFDTNVDDRLLGFLRLSLPKNMNSIIDELACTAIIREVHIYGQSIDIGDRQVGKAQHLGLGTKLIAKARELAHDAGFNEVAVISAIGTRGYYEKLGFIKGKLYMHDQQAAGL